MKYVPFIVLLVLVLITAGCINPNVKAVVTSTPTPEIVYVTGTATPTPSPISQQDDSWINATEDNNNMEVSVGDVWTMTGAVSGTNGPITYSVYNYENYVNKKDYRYPVITNSFYPSADGTYKLDLTINPNIFPVGFYVITFKIPNGQTAKLQFFVDAKGADCPTICDKIISSSQYKEGLQYNNKGEAICYC
jgi:hypothetical protein